MSLTRLKPSRSMNRERDARPPRARPTERGVDLLDEQRATPEPGEAIVRRVVFEAFLEAIAR